MVIQQSQPAAVRIAETLLEAWIRGDLNQLEVELEQAAQCSFDDPDDGERERLQLVKSIAARMKACPNVFASRSSDPGLDLCVDLLAHLSVPRGNRTWLRASGGM